MTKDCTIRAVQAWEALDSRGSPTVAVRVETNRASGQAIAPCGASRSTHEASFPRDGSNEYDGLGVARWIEGTVDKIREVLLGVDSSDFAAVDAAITAADSSSQRSSLGGHVATASAVASWLAGAASQAKEPWQLVAERTERPAVLPMPMVNIISGGAHAGRMLDIQDVLVIPIAASTFSQAIEWAWRVRRAAANVLNERGFTSSLVADEGGVAAPLAADQDALDLVIEAIEIAGLRPGKDVALAIDVAASQFFRDGRYRFAGDDLSPEEFGNVLNAWNREYPIHSIEDPFADDDEIGWKLTKSLLESQVVGDDRYATSVLRVIDGIQAREANAVLVKPNQTASLQESLAVIETAINAGWAPIVSARSGDTEETWLSDLAVGSAAGQLKVGSTTRSERTAKWNRLLQLEATDSNLLFAGAPVVGI